MKTAHKHLLVAVGLAVLTLSAAAQTPPPFAPGPGATMTPGQPGMMQQYRQQRRAEREAALKQILQITPAQEGAWNTWIASRQPSARPRPNPAEWTGLTTPERIDRMRQLRAARIAEMDRRGDATKAFYAALTQPQQKAFDALTAQLMDRGHGRGQGSGWGGWGPHRS
jgi:hypothetical protein